MRQRIIGAAVWLGIFLCGSLLAAALAMPAWAHEAHHQDDTRTNYSNWVNGEDKGCCNNQDCGIAKDEDVSYVGKIQVRISGKWCPVESRHYLKKGGVSNANYNHVCVRVHYTTDDYGNDLPDIDPCERLLCFQPKPLY